MQQLQHAHPILHVLPTGGHNRGENSKQERNERDEREEDKKERPQDVVAASVRGDHWFPAHLNLNNNTNTSTDTSAGENTNTNSNTSTNTNINTNTNTNTNTSTSISTSTTTHTSTPGFDHVAVVDLIVFTHLVFLDVSHNCLRYLLLSNYIYLSIYTYIHPPTND